MKRLRWIMKTKHLLIPAIAMFRYQLNRRIAHRPMYVDSLCIQNHERNVTHQSGADFSWITPPTLIH